ncbi:MAG TPA: zinc ribbon domain-containing protein, partial [Candidatus Obscuribacterales bacterium]
MSTVRETDFLPLSQDYELSATWAPEISIDQYETETQRLSCRFCRAETAQDDRFCQDCGAPQLRDSDGETDSAQREAWRGLAAITAAWSRFTAHAKKVAPAWLFRSARPARGAYLAVVLSAVLFALPPVLHYLYVEKIAAEARQALAENRLNDAVRTCDQLYVARGGSLSAAQREIANEALLRRSQVFAGNGNYRAALSDLAKITPEFSQYAVAITLTRSFAQLFAEQGRQDRRAPGSGGSDERTPVV